MRVARAITLTDEQRETLTKWSRRRRMRARLPNSSRASVAPLGTGSLHADTASACDISVNFTTPEPAADALAAAESRRGQVAEVKTMNGT